MALIAMMASCKKNEANLPTLEEKFSADIEFSVKGAARETQAPHRPFEKYNFLGYGYDVTDNFNDQVSIRANVIDIPSYDASGTWKVDVSRSTEGSWTTLQAKDAISLSEKLSNSFEATKGHKLFGSTITDAFPETVADDKKFVYGYYSNYMIWKRYSIYYDQEVNNYLTTDFKKDVTLLNAKELVYKYGTHVLTRIKIGSKFDVVYQAAAPVESLNREAISMEGLRYALKRTFGLMSGYLDDPNLRNLNSNSSAQIYYSAVGGNFNELKTETINNRLVLNLNKWKASVTEDKAKFIGPLSNGLEPLYKFIDDATKKELVKTYIEQYYITKAVKLKN